MRHRDHAPVMANRGCNHWRVLSIGMGQTSVLPGTGILAQAMLGYPSPTFLNAYKTKRLNAEDVSPLPHGTR